MKKANEGRPSRGIFQGVPTVESKTAEKSRGTTVQSECSNYARDDQLNIERGRDQGRFNAESENQEGVEFHGETVRGLNDMAMERDSNKGKDSSSAGIRLGEKFVEGCNNGMTTPQKEREKLDSKATLVFAGNFCCGPTLADVEKKKTWQVLLLIEE